MHKYLYCVLLLLASVGLTGQTFQLEGTILDANDKTPIIGANILVDNTASRGSVTDLDGKFTLEVAVDETIIISYTGYREKKITITDSNPIEILLETEDKILDEFVVVGYGTQKRSEINGAVSVVLAEDISKTANLRLEQALQGRTSGVQITQSSGSPGNALSVRIRGTGTPLNSDPLYIVDGVWVDGVDFLNPSDIESMSVLKDAASVAIYGTSGANGVVIITTKEGKKGSKGTITYDGYRGQQEVARTVDLLNAQEYATLILEANENNPLNIPDPASLGEGTNWQNEIFQTAPIESHQLSFLGGSEKTTYGITGGYFKQDGIVGGDKSAFERYSARFKGSNQVKDWFKIVTNVNYTRFKRNALPENNEFSSPVAFALNIDPITSVYKDDGTFNFSPYVVGDVKNPVNRIDKTYSTFTSDRLIGLIGQELKIGQALTFKTNASMDITFAENFGFGPSYNLDSTGTFVHERVDQNSVSKERLKWTNFLIENLLEYNKTFAETHTVSALVGTSFRERNSEGLYVGLADLPVNTPEDAFIAAQNINDGNMDNRSIGEWISESALLSYFTRVNYNYKDKYFLTASMRRDGSSRFGAENKFANFPAVSAGWLITKDYNILKSLNFLKLKASWGKNGNEASLSDYGFTTIIDPVRYVFGSDQTLAVGSAPTVPANPELKWEVSTQTDFGFDAGLFNDRVTLTVDYFIKSTDDILIPASILATAGSGINGSSPPFQNIGSMENKGWEFAVGYRNNFGQLNVDIAANATFIKNTVTGLGDFTTPFSSGYNQGLGGNTTRMEEGMPLGFFYGYVTDGVFENRFEVKEYLNAAGEEIQPKAEAGDFKFVDINGDGIISDLDQTMVGNPYPDAVIALTTSLDYKGFDLNIFLQGTVGNDIVNATTRYDLLVSNLPAARFNRWTPDNINTDQPAMSTTDLNQNFRFSDYFVEDGSYLRLKTVQLGYTLPKSFTRKFLVEKFRVYISAQNLLTFTKYTGLDPEIGKANPYDNSISSNLNYGVDRGLYPQAKIFMGGINIQF
ncbi:MAG: TonB-dependent receptor [Saprospiraceae bacterium]|nr:TonB-dependent receptor [Saprospiraceae bacterium]